MTVTTHPMTPGELRRDLARARTAQAAAARRVAALEDRLGISATGDALAKTYAIMYGDTPEKCAARRRDLLNATAAQHRHTPDPWGERYRTGAA